MMLYFGKDKQLKFKDEEEYYFVLGMMTNMHLTRIYIEDNLSRGSYADAYRITLQTSRINNVPDSLKNAMRDGNRINCNEYAKHLISKHNFYVQDIPNSNIKNIVPDYRKTKSTVPAKYIPFFEQGYNY